MSHEKGKFPYAFFVCLTQWHETGCIGSFSEKTGVSRTMAITKMEFFMALVTFSY